MTISLQQVNKRFEGPELFRDFSMEIAEGRTTAFLGPSGCGKTTLLRIIAGVEAVESGQILRSGKSFSEDMRISFLFQEDRLIPWLTAGENIELVLQAHFSGAEVRKRRDWALDLVGLTESEKLLPDSLSGGMQRRVAIARTVAHDGDLILLDEPFKGLDAARKEQLQGILAFLWKKQKKTILLVTHDLDEAGRMADDIYYLEGRPVSAQRV